MKGRIQKFKSKGFTTHVINYIRWPNGEYTAFDLTTKETLPEEDLYIKFFSAKSKGDLLDQLKKYYETHNSWS